MKRRGGRGGKGGAAEKAAEKSAEKEKPSPAGKKPTEKPAPASKLATGGKKSEDGDVGSSSLGGKSEYLANFSSEALSSRVGPTYQASVKDFEATGAQPSSKKEIEGEAFWQAHKMEDSAALDKYLAFVKKLFADDENLYCELRALFLLHQCDYNVKDAMYMLKPRAAPKQEDDDDEYEGDDACFVCREGGNLLLCDGDNEECRKVYHMSCINLAIVPQGKWECPCHFCTVCNERVDIPSLALMNDRSLAPINAPQLQCHRCHTCPVSYCPSHVPRDSKAMCEKLGVLEFMCKACLEKEKVAAADNAPPNMQPAEVGRRGFMKRLVRLLKRLETPLTKTPLIGNKEIDLYTFYAETIKRGGLQRVINVTGWGQVRQALKIPSSTSNIAYTLRRIYLNLLYTYERRYFPASMQLQNKSGPMGLAIGNVDGGSEQPLSASSASSSSSSAASSASGTPARKRGRAEKGDEEEEGEGEEDDDQEERGEEEGEAADEKS